MISIHAPANGATGHKSFVSTASSFQSTLRRTERRKISRNREVRTTISIHAPTNGATSVNNFSDGINRFQSTLRRTERLQCIPVSFSYSSFQSTLRRTERPQLLCKIKLFTIISIHAPANGATDSLKAANKVVAISIHAPANGATLYHFLNH